MWPYKVQIIIAICKVFESCLATMVASLAGALAGLPAGSSAALVGPEVDGREECLRGPK